MVGRGVVGRKAVGRGVVGRGVVAKAVLCAKVVHVNGSNCWMMMSHTGKSRH